MEFDELDDEDEDDDPNALAMDTVDEMPPDMFDNDDNDDNMDSEIQDMSENMESGVQDLSENMDSGIQDLSDTKHELMERFLKENSEVLQVKPSLNGVVGPSLWNLLTATKEVKALDHQKLMQCYSVKGDEEALDPRGIEDEETMVKDDSAAKEDVFSDAKGDFEQKEVSYCENGVNGEVPDSDGEEAVVVNADAGIEGEELDGLALADVLVIQPTCPDDEITVMDDTVSPQLIDTTNDTQRNTQTVVRDRMVVPLNELELSAICSSAVDFVVRHKTPTKVFNQLSAMQAQQLNKNSIPIYTQNKRQDQAKPGEVQRKYKCPKCVYQTDNKSHLRRHVSSVHFIGMPYYCYICNKDFPRSEKVKMHFFRMHPNVDYDHRLVRKDNFFGTGYSPERAAMLIAQETAEKHNPNEISVTLTPKNMRTSNMAQNRGSTSKLSPVISGALSLPTPPDQQENILSPPISEGIDLSGAVAGALAMLTPQNRPQLQKPIWKSPSKSEAGEKRYYCPECPYTGKDIWHLKRHVNDVHQQRKDLKCPMCDYSTGRKHRLVTHMKGHGMLFCFHCDFSTSNLLLFQAHVKVNTCIYLNLYSNNVSTCITRFFIYQVSTGRGRGVFHFQM